ncbi:hypothetical protein CY34DRAFT_809762 [Suillus luteus UH-Slu-Lm8-n1]|uniref:Uncharacterized protein n=1 Tax=Suillus luteus UH-Slu-Lm8-n1 TaxID=930992 RepID=A0A0D0A8N5_9AGAM|nr:hypothetical protein CY34DRAFT_809762 [Suillus luteus UH-Slu-Lm8-n1]
MEESTFGTARERLQVRLWLHIRIETHFYPPHLRNLWRNTVQLDTTSVFAHPGQF